jgi:hypothetical protein
MFRTERPDSAEYSGPDALWEGETDRNVCRWNRRRERHADLQGPDYPFRLLCSGIGPGGGAERITASGEVYKLANVNDFQGRYTQKSGPAGLSQAGEGQLWRQNNHGAIMHHYSTSRGVLLSIAKE